MIARVVQVIDSLSHGGAERMAVEIANELAVRDIDVELVATRALGPLSREVHEAVATSDLGRRKRWDLGGLCRFRRLVAQRQPDVVHAHGWSSLRFCTASLVTLRSAPPLVFHDHRPAGLERSSPADRAAAWPLVRAHIAVDRRLIEPPLPSRWPMMRTTVPNGIPFGRIEQKTTQEMSEPPRLVALANLRPQKDHLALLEAMSLVVQRRGPVTLDLIGATPDRAYEAACLDAIGALGLTGCVKLLGSRPDVGRLLSGYDLGVLSSKAESGPIALIEYLAAGLPFVVTDVGEIPALLPADLRRSVVPPGDPTALAGKIVEAIDATTQEREQQAKRGRTFASRHYTIEVTVDSILAVYEQICRPRA